MNSCFQITTFCLLSVLLISGGGCGRFTASSVDEEKEAHYLAGKSRLYSHDYRGAMEAFEKSLRVIPQSAAAHLELGLLNYKQFGNHAEAIHHFQKMLEYRADHPVGERIKDHIKACKLALASEVTLPPVNQRIEMEMKRLIKENEGLTNLVAQLEGQVSQLKVSLARTTVPTGEVGGSTARTERSVREPSPANPRRSVAPPVSRARGVVSTARSQPMFLKHVLKSGETFYGLSSRYGLGVKEIQRVNPGLNPKTLRIGHVINIPIARTAAVR